MSAIFDEDKPRKARKEPDLAAQAIVAKLRELRRWPCGSDKRLDSAVKRSLDAYRIFREKVVACAVDEELDAFIAWIYPEMVRDPEDFIVWWFLRVHDLIKGWDSWSGNLEPFVFREMSDRFDDFGSGLAIKYGDRRLWTWLMEALNKR